MLTRLKIKGFKNLFDVDIHFAPFTCIAGPNGVGKSNLFDAITFLSRLSNERLDEAAGGIRSEPGTISDISSLFFRSGDYQADRMYFEAEMIIPKNGRDDLNQPAEAKITFVSYTLELAYHVDESSDTLGSLRIEREELKQLKKTDAANKLKFKHSKKKWRDSVITGRSTSPFISTETKNGLVHIKQHQDGKGGRPKWVLAHDLPRTVLSRANAAESPTALLARREMESWRLLQLEPSAMRKSDPFTTKAGLQSDGSRLPATLDYLDRINKEHSIFDAIAGRVSELVENIRKVSVDRNEIRQLLTLQIEDMQGTRHPALALSDGTLRFIALAVLELDPSAGEVICLEEPENGIHPERIPAILSLLNDIAVDTNEAVDETNPLRQVIINTHAPKVVGQVSTENLLMAEPHEILHDNKRLKGVIFKALPNSWWESWQVPLVSRGDILRYLETNFRPRTFENTVYQAVQVDLPFGSET